ncbi:MAG TPA: hypothetical protein VL306_00100, partial [Methylomirabilota bacterium]|nr:hypothetical protein [Methylomirabilota bacterium]
MLDSSDPIFEKWQKEQAYLEAQKQLHPELFVKSEALGTQEQLARVGIVLPFQALALGYIKYYPFDFIVEERQSNGQVITVDGKEYEENSQASGSFFHADLVKVGISTIDAIKELSRKLGIKET